MLSAYSYSFGSPMPGRTFTSTNQYRYGFNGKENDSETSTQDYGMRIYNPSLGRFLSVDPLSQEYPWNSTYAFAENRPIDGIDLDGAEWGFGGLLSIYDKLIPVLETKKSNQVLVDVAKFTKGLIKSTPDGAIADMSNKTAEAIKQVKQNPKTAKQFVKKTVDETIKSSEQKMVEGLSHMVKGALMDKDPEATGQLIGMLIQLYVCELGTSAPKVNPFEGLSPAEAGALGEELMIAKLKEKYAGQNVKILEQIYAKSDSKGTYIDATVVEVTDQSGKILEVAESKYNTSEIKPGSGQDAMYNENKDFTAQGKAASEAGVTGAKVDANTVRSVYRWSKEGELSVQSINNK